MSLILFPAPSLARNTGAFFHGIPKHIAAGYRSLGLQSDGKGSWEYNLYAAKTDLKFSKVRIKGDLGTRCFPQTPADRQTRESFISFIAPVCDKITGNTYIAGCIETYPGGVYHCSPALFRSLKATPFQFDRVVTPWDTFDAGTGGAKFDNISVYNGKIFLGCNYKYTVLASNDGGANWTERTIFANSRYLVESAIGASIALVQGSLQNGDSTSLYNFFTAPDPLGTMTQRNPQTSDATNAGYRAASNILIGSTKMVITSEQNEQMSNALISTPGTWIARNSNPPNAIFDRGTAYDTDKFMVAVRLSTGPSVYGIWRSINGGDTWAAAPNHPNTALLSQQLVNDGSRVYTILRTSTGDGLTSTIWYTDDGGATAWINADQGSLDAAMNPNHPVYHTPLF